MVVLSLVDGAVRELVERWFANEVSANGLVGPYSSANDEVEESDLEGMDWYLFSARWCRTYPAVGRLLGFIDNMCSRRSLKNCPYLMAN